MTNRLSGRIFEPCSWADYAKVAVVGAVEGATFGGIGAAIASGGTAVVPASAATALINATRKVTKRTLECAADDIFER